MVEAVALGWVMVIGGLIAGVGWGMIFGRWGVKTVVDNVSTCD